MYANKLVVQKIGNGFQVSIDDPVRAIYAHRMEIGGGTGYVDQCAALANMDLPLTEEWHALDARQQAGIMNETLGRIFTKIATGNVSQQFLDKLASDYGADFIRHLKHRELQVALTQHELTCLIEAVLDICCIAFQRE